VSVQEQEARMMFNKAIQMLRCL